MLRGVRYTTGICEIFEFGYLWTSLFSWFGFCWFSQEGMGMMLACSKMAEPGDEKGLLEGSALRLGLCFRFCPSENEAVSWLIGSILVIHPGGTAILLGAQRQRPSEIR